MLNVSMMKRSNSNSAKERETMLTEKELTIDLELAERIGGLDQSLSDEELRGRFVENMT